MEDERNAYKEAEQHIEMFFTQPSNLNVKQNNVYIFDLNLIYKL